MNVSDINSVLKTKARSAPTNEEFATHQVVPKLKIRKAMQVCTNKCHPPLDFSSKSSHKNKSGIIPIKTSGVRLPVNGNEKVRSIPEQRLNR